jgi:hypothetical protein
VKIRLRKLGKGFCLYRRRFRLGVIRFLREVVHMLYTADIVDVIRSFIDSLRDVLV